MQTELQATEDDYKKFLTSYFFKRNLLKRLALVIILSLWIGSFNVGDQSFTMSAYVLKSVVALIILFMLFVLTPYILAKVKFNKAFKTNVLIRTKTIVTNDEGIIITTENENIFWRWETLENAEIINSYLFFSLFTNKFFLIPLSVFLNNNEAINCLGVIKRKIQRDRGGNKYRKIRNLHYLGLVGIIPNFGVIAGIILFVKGFQYNKITLILVGVADILFTIFFWMVLSPLINPNGFKDLSQMQLNSLIKNVEFYKLENGQYPDSLQQLKKDGELAPINDPIQSDNNRRDSYYNYKRVGDKYLLFSSGLDGVPHTADDLYPVFSSNDSSKIGFIKSE